MTDNKIILKQIKNAVALVDTEAQVILFGSRARGDFKEGSDWDILVLTSLNVELDLQRKISARILNVELENAIGISTIIRNKKDWRSRFSVTPFYKEVEKDGVLL